MVGTMGGGIVMCFVERGIPVVVLEPQQRFLDKGLGGKHVTLFFV